MSHVVPLPAGTRWEPSVVPNGQSESLMGVQVFALMVTTAGHGQHAIDADGNPRWLIGGRDPDPTLGRLVYDRIVRL